MPSRRKTVFQVRDTVGVRPIIDNGRFDSEQVLTPHRIAIASLFAIAYALPLPTTGQDEASEPYAVGFDDGEVLLDDQGRTTSIAVSPETGSTDLAFWTTELPAGSDIILHRHDRTEEILFIHRGSGMLIVGDERVPVQEGTTIFVPRGTYHGMEPQENDLTIVFVATPPGLVNFFRALGWHEGEEPKVLTLDEIQLLEQRYDSIANPVP